MSDHPDCPNRGRATDPQDGEKCDGGCKAPVLDNGLCGGCGKPAFDQPSVEVSEEAVEAAKQAFERVPNGAQFREKLTQLPEYGEAVVVPPAELARQMLQAAAPAIAAKAVEAELERCTEDHVSKIEATKRLNEAVEEKDAEIEWLQKELDEAARQRQDRTREMVERLCPYLKEQDGLAEMGALAAALCEREISRAEKAEQAVEEKGAEIARLKQAIAAEKLVAREDARHEATLQDSKLKAAIQKERERLITKLLSLNLLTVELEEAIRGSLDQEDSDGS